MDTKDAWLLVGGAILGFLASLLATFAAPPISKGFGKLKSSFIERNKASALAAYRTVHDLQSGKRDKYLYAISGWGFLNALTLLGILAGVGGFATARVFGPFGSRDNLGVKLLLLIMPLVLIVMVLRRVFRLVLTLARVANFEDYRSALAKRFPEIQTSDLE